MAASKQGSAAKIPYFESLDSASKVRYLAKLKVIGNLDPYTMSADRFSADPTYLPSVNYANIYTYLVNTPSPYTKDELECYKGLDAYNQFVSGWVRDVKATVVENSHLVIGRQWSAAFCLLCDNSGSQWTKQLKGSTNQNHHTEDRVVSQHRRCFQKDGIIHAVSDDQNSGNNHFFACQFSRAAQRVSKHHITAAPDPEDAAGLKKSRLKKPELS